jgi:hypothetical protein
MPMTTPPDEKKAMNWDLKITHDWGEGDIGPGRYQIDFGPLNFGMDGEEGIYCDDIEEVKRAQDAINSHDSLIKQRDELRKAAQEYINDGECYCPDDFKTHNPCGYCALKSALLHSEGTPK